MADVVEVDRLVKDFASRAGVVRAVDGVTFRVASAEVLGLVGESGSGKSTIARLVAGLQSPTSGTVKVRGRDMSLLRGGELRALRRRMQMVFQNPYGSLLPHFSAIGNVIEPLRLHAIGNSASRRARALELFELVGISSRAADFYPRQFSGGEQQRIAIARALALEPDLVIYDEPTSSLDVSIQAQILVLLQEIHARLGVSALFISHNLAVIERVADRVIVLRNGSVVESGSTRDVFRSPEHPYTRDLIQAILPVRGTAATRPATNGPTHRQFGGTQ